MGIAAPGRASVSFSCPNHGRVSFTAPDLLAIKGMDHFWEALSSNLLITREYLKAGVLVSLLSVWVLVGLFYYLNRYTKRRYFTIWTAAWLFYALWITLSFGVDGTGDQKFLLIVEQWCIGVSAVFLLWGSLSFLNRPVRTPVLG